MALHVQQCMPRSSYLGLFIAYICNAGPALVEVIRVFRYYNATFVDKQDKFASFWFRVFRLGYLGVAVMYSIARLVYECYIQNVFAVMVAVRLLCGLCLLCDQYWFVKNWVPFVVHAGKRRLIWYRLAFGPLIYYVVLASSTFTSWQTRQNIFSTVFAFCLLAISVGNCSYLYHGSDCLIKHRYHFVRNVFMTTAICLVVLGTVGLIVGDGGGDDIWANLGGNGYHSFFVLMYGLGFLPFAIALQYCLIVPEELTWSQEKSLATARMAAVAQCTLAARVACGNDFASIEMPRLTAFDCPVSVIDTSIRSDVQEDQYYPPLIVTSVLDQNGGNCTHSESGCGEQETPHVEANVGVEAGQSTRTSGINTSQFVRRMALSMGQASSKNLISTVLSKRQQFLVKRHAFASLEVEKVAIIVSQVVFWEFGVWIGQMSLASYLRNVAHVPEIPGAIDGYFCPSYIGHPIQTLQFSVDNVFLRRR